MAEENPIAQPCEDLPDHRPSLEPEKKQSVMANTSDEPESPPSTRPVLDQISEIPSTPEGLICPFTNALLKENGTIDVFVSLPVQPDSDPRPAKMEPGSESGKETNMESGKETNVADDHGRIQKEYPPSNENSSCKKEVVEVHDRHGSGIVKDSTESMLDVVAKDSRLPDHYQDAPDVQCAEGFVDESGDNMDQYMNGTLNVQDSSEMKDSILNGDNPGDIKGSMSKVESNDALEICKAAVFERERPNSDVSMEAYGLDLNEDATILTQDQDGVDHPLLPPSKARHSDTNRARKVARFFSRIKSQGIPGTSLSVKPTIKKKSRDLLQELQSICVSVSRLNEKSSLLSELEKKMDGLHGTVLQLRQDLSVFSTHINHFFPMPVPSNVKGLVDPLPSNLMGDVSPVVRSSDNDGDDHRRESAVKSHILRSAIQFFPPGDPIIEKVIEIIETLPTLRLLGFLEASTAILNQYPRISSQDTKNIGAIITAGNRLSDTTLGVPANDVQDLDCAGKLNDKVPTSAAMPANNLEDMAGKLNDAIPLNVMGVVGPDSSNLMGDVVSVVRDNDKDGDDHRSELAAQRHNLKLQILRSAIQYFPQGDPIIEKAIEIVEALPTLRLLEFLEACIPILNRYRRISSEDTTNIAATGGKRPSDTTVDALANDMGDIDCAGKLDDTSAALLANNLEDMVGKLNDNVPMENICAAVHPNETRGADPVEELVIVNSKNSQVQSPVSHSKTDLMDEENGNVASKYHEMEVENSDDSPNLCSLSSSETDSVEEGNGTATSNNDGRMKIKVLVPRPLALRAVSGPNFELLRKLQFSYCPNQDIHIAVHKHSKEIPYKIGQHLILRIPSKRRRKH